MIVDLGLLGLLLVGLRLVRVSRSRRARAANEAPRVTGGQPELTRTQLWSLAASAIFARRNNDRWDRMKLGAGVEAVQAMLSDSWDVHGPADAEPILDWLAGAGHTERLREDLAVLAAVPPAQVEAWLARQPPDKAPRLGFAHRHRAELADGKLVAWDLVRLINLARALVTVGWLTEAAAWKHILPAARRLQREYRSWEELSRKFMIGRHYWGEGEGTQPRFDAAAAWLLGDPASPWRQLAWATPLDVAESSRGAGPPGAWRPGVPP
ncbi:MAG TPA: DUF1266 domain-containing protein [Thermoanaerobaculia bacterium]|nr:DUF1266 domain-containing protein [Thermoanaerobaculia bacterium]